MVGSIVAPWCGAGPALLKVSAGVVQNSFLALMITGSSPPLAPDIDELEYGRGHPSLAHATIRWRRNVETYKPMLKSLGLIPLYLN